MRKQAALWSARLLPFIDLLSNYPNVEDLVLSSLSELPADEFLADMLAYTFPLSDSEGKKSGVDAKLKRVVTRLSSTPERGPDSQLLSVRYQSKSEQFITNRAVAFNNRNKKLDASLLAGSHGETLVINGKDLSVGSFLFEYDSGYLDFLETLFTIIVSPLARNELSPPHLSEFKPDTIRVEDNSPVSYAIQPLLDSLLTRWSQMPFPQKYQEMNHETAGSKKSTGRKLAKRRSRLSSSAMRVNLSVPVIIGCLRQREEALLSGEDQGGGDGVEPKEKVKEERSESGALASEKNRDGTKLETRVEEDKSAVSGALPSEESQDGAELREKVIEKVVKKKKDKPDSESDESLCAKSYSKRNRENQSTSTSSDSSIASDTLETTGTLKAHHGIILLQVPDGILQVILSCKFF